MNGTSIRESSRVVRLIRTAQAGSAIAGIGRRLAVRLPILVRDVQRQSAPDDHRAIVVFEASAIVRALLRLVARVELAVRRSETAHIASSLRVSVWALPVDTRIRQAAVVLCTAVTVHLLMTRFNAPEPTTLARVVWIGIALLLVAVIAGARGVAAAWVEWSGRRATAGTGERR